MGKHELNENKKNSKSKKIFKIIAIIMVIIIFIVLGVGGGGYLYVRNSLGKMQQVEINEDSIEMNEGIKESLSGYRIIALFGVDSRESQLEKGTRSDCIMLAIIDQNSKNIKLVSVYRDTYLQIGNRGLDKVTHAYAYGGAELAMSTLNKNLDLNITEFATVNFDSLVDIVDAIGGIQINIEADEIKHLNDYIDSTSQTVGKTSAYVSKTGNQTLNGIQSVSYARIRYTAGGDYKRTERMRTVLTAIANKAKTLGINDLNKLATTVLPKVYTNISPDEIISMLPQIATYIISESKGWPYETKGDTIGGVWYGVPINLANNVQKLHQEIMKQQNYSVSKQVEEISDSIIKKTGYK